MSAHTPGPWGVVINKHETRVISGPVVGRVVAHVVLEREANARLIAAAPELLEALRYVVAAFDAQVASYRANDDHAIADIAEQVHGARMDRARAAIAKAEGK